MFNIVIGTTLRDLRHYCNFFTQFGSFVGYAMLSCFSLKSGYLIHTALLLYYSTESRRDRSKFCRFGSGYSIFCRIRSLAQGLCHGVVSYFGTNTKYGGTMYLTLFPCQKIEGQDRKGRSKYIRESAPISPMASYVAQIQSMNRRCFCKAFASNSLRVSLPEDNLSHGPLDWKLWDPFQHIHSCEDQITNIHFNSRLLIF